MVPEYVLLLDEEGKQSVVEVVHIQCKRRVRTLSQFHTNPLEYDVHHFLQVLGLSANHANEFLDTLHVLFEVATKHQLGKVLSKYVFRVFLQGLDLVLVQLIVHPL